MAGKLVVCDSGNRRLLVWSDPSETGQPADLVLGQHDFSTRDENAGGEVTAMSMRWPHGACWWNGHLALADSGNNRVQALSAEEGAPLFVYGASRAATATARELDHALGYFACQLHAVETFPDVVSSDDVEREWMNACQTLRGNVLSVDAREMGTVIERTRATCAVVEGVFGFPVEPLANAVDALELISRPKQSDE